MRFLRPAAFVLFASLPCLALASPAHAATGSVVLSWASSGDDSLTGVAAQYDLRYSTAPITASNFGSAIRVATVPAPGPAGTLQTCTVSNLPAGITYYFAIKSSDEAGNWSAISNVLMKPGSVTSLADPAVELRFSTPWPNPSRVAATFEMAMPRRGMVEVDAFDVLGRHVRQIVSADHEAGPDRVIWDLRDDQGRSLEPGVYLVHAAFGGTSFNRRVVVTR